MTTRSFTLSGSSALAGGSYDDETMDLKITFTNGRSYTYERVPPDVVAGLEQAPSAGTFFNERIKGVFD